MASTEPSRTHKTMPWMAAKTLDKDPPTRLKHQIRTRSINLVLPVVTLPLILASGPPIWLVVPGIGGGMVHSIFTIRQLKTKPEIFLEKDAKTRALLDNYQAQTAAGTWTGAKYRPKWMFTAPVAALAVAIQPPLLLHVSWLVGIAAGLATFAGIVVFNLVKMRKTIGEARQRMAAPAAATAPTASRGH
jgi:hypothetical protein